MNKVKVIMDFGSFGHVDTTNKAILFKKDEELLVKKEYNESLKKDIYTVYNDNKESTFSKEEFEMFFKYID